MLAEEENVCQEMTTKLEEQSAHVGLNISREKTKVRGITQRPSTQPIAVAQGNIEYVERFTYLGTYLEMEMWKQISTLDWQRQQQSFDDLTTCGDSAHLA